MLLNKLFALAAFLATAGAASAEIDYHVAVVPDQNRLNVEISFRNSGASQVTLQMPNWMPGLYILWPSGINVHDFQATGEKALSRSIIPTRTPGRSTPPARKAST